MVIMDNSRFLSDEQEAEVGFPRAHELHLRGNRNKPANGFVVRERRGTL
jgi:hypothetical protein